MADLPLALTSIAVFVVGIGFWQLSRQIVSMRRSVTNLMLDIRVLRERVEALEDGRPPGP